MKGELKRDFKGQLLCEHCFNGFHFTKERNCACLAGGCECLCSQVKSDYYFQLVTKRERKIQERLAQQRLFPDNIKVPKRKKRRREA